MIVITFLFYLFYNNTMDIDNNYILDPNLYLSLRIQTEIIHVQQYQVVWVLALVRFYKYVLKFCSHTWWELCNRFIMTNEHLFLNTCTLFTQFPSSAHMILIAILSYGSSHIECSCGSLEIFPAPHPHNTLPAQNTYSRNILRVISPLPVVESL